MAKKSKKQQPATLKETPTYARMAWNIKKALRDYDMECFLFVFGDGCHVIIPIRSGIWEDSEKNALDRKLFDRLICNDPQRDLWYEAWVGVFHPNHGIREIVEELRDACES